LLRWMHDTDCAHVGGGAETHDRKARNRRLDGGLDGAVPAHQSDVEAAGSDHGDCPHAGVDDDPAVTNTNPVGVRLSHHDHAPWWTGLLGEKVDGGPSWPTT